MKPETKQYDSEFFFNQLVARLKAAGAEAEAKVAGHVTAKTGHSTLPSYHSNGATEEEKLELYKELLKAVLSKNYDALLAAPEAKPAAVEVVDTTPPARPANVVTIPAPEPPQAQPEPKPVKLETVRTEPEPAAEDDVAATIAKAVAKVLPKGGAVDPGLIRRMVDERIEQLGIAKAAHQEMLNAKFELVKHIDEQIDARLQVIADRIGEALTEEISSKK